MNAEQVKIFKKYLLMKKDDVFTADDALRDTESLLIDNDQNSELVNKRAKL